MAIQLKSTKKAALHYIMEDLKNVIEHLLSATQIIDQANTLGIKTYIFNWENYLSVPSYITSTSIDIRIYGIFSN